MKLDGNHYFLDNPKDNKNSALRVSFIAEEMLSFLSKKYEKEHNFSALIPLVIYLQHFCL